MIAYSQEDLINTWIQSDQDVLSQETKELSRAQLFSSKKNHTIEKTVIEKAISELKSYHIKTNSPSTAIEISKLELKLKTLIDSNIPANHSRWFKLYIKTAEMRRLNRLELMQKESHRIIFVSGYNISPSFFAYTEGQSDAQNERSFLPGSTLEMLDLSTTPPERTILLQDKKGVIRDPDVSYDGERILFSWKKDLNKDDFHLYEMTVKTSEIKQLTFGLGFADYEPSYLPNNDIIFSSTRPVQTVDCWWTEVSNLYLCNAQGNFIRRVGFDQVHTIYPKVMNDGRILYTRWDYNDRGQLFPQPLFQMNMDGTAQQEFYGNSSWFPTTLSHARPITDSRKMIGIAMGHHTPQMGKLVIIDAQKGRQENEGIQYFGPMKKADAVRIDQFGQEGYLYQYPIALNDQQVISGFSQNKKGQKDVLFPADNKAGSMHPARFSLIWLDKEGNRELLASDSTITLKQPVFLKSRLKPAIKSSPVDYRQKSGTVYLHNVMKGPGLKGIAKGTIKKLRIVELKFRSSGIGYNHNNGEAGNAMVSTPIAVANGSWDIKKVLGTIDIDENGSALFEVPARKALYFQALNSKNEVVQTMRSWLTLQPGENVSCIGCHEDKNDSPDYQQDYGSYPQKQLIQTRTGTPYHADKVEGFSFIKKIQPILDQHCISCHTNRVRKMGSSRSHGTPFQLRAKKIKDKQAGRIWLESYLNLTAKGVPNHYINWMTAQSVPELLPPQFAGSITSKLPILLRKGHHNVKLCEDELETINCWIDLGVPFCGSYEEAALWSDADWKKYNHFVEKRARSEEIEKQSIEAHLSAERQ